MRLGRVKERPAAVQRPPRRGGARALYEAITAELGAADFAVFADLADAISRSVPWEELGDNDQRTVARIWARIAP